MVNGKHTFTPPHAFLAVGENKRLDFTFVYCELDLDAAIGKQRTLFHRFYFVEDNFFLALIPDTVSTADAPAPKK